MTAPAAKSRQPSRDKILDCAEALFARRGFAGVGLREVAESVGLGKSSLFHHFPSKAELYAAVVGRILARIEDAADARAGRRRHAGGAARALARRPRRPARPSTARYARLLLRSLFEDDDLTGELPEERAANETHPAHRRRRRGAAARGHERRARSAPASVPHTLQTLIGATVYHFASGEFGDEMLGAADLRRRPRCAGARTR